MPGLESIEYECTLIVREPANGLIERASRQCDPGAPNRQAGIPGDDNASDDTGTLDRSGDSVADLLCRPDERRASQEPGQEPELLHS